MGYEVDGQSMIECGTTLNVHFLGVKSDQGLQLNARIENYEVLVIKKKPSLASFKSEDK